MVIRRILVCGVGLAVGAAVMPGFALGQEETGHRRGRKYKAPPETSHVEVEVVKEFNGKPVVNAAVVFHPVKDGRDEGNLEMKTDPDGKAIIDVIPTGSSVRVQVIANGFATFAEDYLINDASKEIHIKMRRPQAQISTYVDNEGKVSERKSGVQEPVRNPVVAKPPAGKAAAEGKGVEGKGTSVGAAPVAAPKL